MKRTAVTAVCFWAVVLPLAQPAGAAESLTYADLVGRMTDLAHLAVLPAAGETTAQWSSYDRASKYDEATGKYVHWDANGDGKGIIRREGEREVMAEMEGPGCIWRIWSAAAAAGHVKIYLDGRETPAVDLPFHDYFDGQHAPFNYPQLSYDLREQKSRGQNLYFPIPYQKSCKVVADNGSGPKGWGVYFHFTYQTFPKNTTVPTFSSALAAENAAALEKANAFFHEHLGEDPAGKRPGEETLSKAVSLGSGQTVRVAEIAGPRAITALRVKARFADREDEISALRKVVLRITWDGASKPGVWCPLGDFFGTAPGVNLYKSLPAGMTSDGFYSYWYMPLASRAVVELASDDRVGREFQVEVVHAPLGRPFAGLGHFHAQWHRDICPLPEDRWPDWVMLRAEGQGRFCGVMLHVWNPLGGWWGEGDEKFFVDGEKFPSTIGTGSEDYFGYAWGDPHLFQNPYHCQTMTENNRGHQSLLRWHLLDNVPFQQSFEGCIEKYFRNTKGTLYACTAYWYQAPGGSDPIEPAPADARHGYWVRPQATAGGLKILGTPPGNVQTQAMAHYGRGRWKDDQQLWWTHAKPGQKLEIALPISEPGRYELSVVLTKAKDYGIVQFSVNGQPAGAPVDLYNPQVIPTEPIVLGTYDFPAGESKLSVEIVGANPKAVPSYMFGLDQVKFKRL